MRLESSLDDCFGLVRAWCVCRSEYRTRVKQPATGPRFAHAHTLVAHSRMSRACNASRDAKYWRKQQQPGTRSIRA
jgi:hypothetical protein